MFGTINLARISWFEYASNLRGEPATIISLGIMPI